MKFVHTADWHLGYRQYGMAVREQDFLRPLSEIGDIAEREKADAVLVSGDMFDSFRPPASAVEAARAFGDRMRGLRIPVLSVDGNHDLSGGKWARLCGFEPLDLDGEDAGKPFNAGGCWFYGIDFCRTQQLMDKLEELKGKGMDLHGGVMALHMEIAELAAYSTALSLRDLEPYLDALNVGYVALGHIHNAIDTCTEAGRIYRYPGSTEMNDTSELGLKGVDVVTRDSNGFYKCEPLTLNTRKFDVVDVDSADGIDEKLKPIMDDVDTFWLVKVNLSAAGKLISRVEEALKDRLYRILPYGSRSIEENVAKATVVVGLKDAISAFFTPDSDEASLIRRIIDTPDQTKAIAEEYVRPKKEDGK